jgi:hypothetical protein
MTGKPQMLNRTLRLRALELLYSNPMRAAHTALDAAAISSFILQTSSFLPAPGIPPDFPEPELLVTNDCIQPQAA